MMYDHAKIYVKAGNGGRGSASFRREKFAPMGGPDGGDGGRGGSIYLRATDNLNTLLPFHYKQHFKAVNGGQGLGNKMHGAAGDDLYIDVPVGTFVRVTTPETFDPETSRIVIPTEKVMEADLISPGQTVMVAAGGKGGLGNTHFATATHQAPRISELGGPGQERVLYLELKLIADVGLIGYPNVGKSTLLAAATAARPKIADYPFTTLSPMLGVVEIDADNSFVLADIPGLIEGASEGVGLGLEFLRHIERTHLLIHVIDGAIGSSGLPERDPISDYRHINHELELYQPELGLVERPQLVAVNKMDIPEARAAYPEIKATLQVEKPDIEVFPIAAATGEGVRELMFAAYRHLQQVKREIPKVESGAEGDGEVKLFRAEDINTEGFSIERERKNLYRVRSAKIERLVAMTNFTHRDNIERLNKRLTKEGLYRALVEAGIKEGDQVAIGDATLGWTAQNEIDWRPPTVQRGRKKLNPTRRKTKKQRTAAY
ncbi:MAG: GTPase ObgE, partial [Candidatus Chloroheliales bacterium]